MSYLSNRDLVNRDLVINIHYFQSKINKKAGFGLNMAKICVFDEISRLFVYRMEVWRHMVIEVHLDDKAPKTA